MDNLPPMHAKKRIWGNIHTKMDAIYHHTGRKEEEDSYDRACGNGKHIETKPDLLQNKVCFKCQKQYSPTTSICPECNIELDYKTWEEKQQNFMEELLEKRLDELLKKKLDERLK